MHRASISVSQPPPPATASQAPRLLGEVLVLALFFQGLPPPPCSGYFAPQWYLKCVRDD